MRKIIALVLVFLFITSTACLAYDRKIGVLQSETSAPLHYQHILEHHNKNSTVGTSDEHVVFENLNSLLMALRSGNVAQATLPLTTCRYIVQRNPDMELIQLDHLAQKTSYSMMMRSEDEDLQLQLNRIFDEMKKDGSLEALIENQMEACIETDPAAVSLPHFEGAETIRVALTGDLPPMDYVSADGQPAGFNIALLTEIANRLKVNFEPVTVTAGSRIQALSSGRVDLVFWSNSAYCEEHEFASALPIEGALLTDHYLLEKVSNIALKG